MPKAIEVTQNDLKPDLYFQLYNRANTEVLDISLSTTTVSAKFRVKGDDESLFEVALSKVLPDVGVVKMEWPADSLDVDVGRYELEVTVSFDGSPQTVVDIVSIKVREEFGAVA